MQVSYHKRKLPHIQVENMLHFITFRTYKSVDAYVKKISSLELDTKIKQYRLDTYLDNSSNGAYFFSEEIRLMREILFEFDRELYELFSFAIMPNHVHIVLKPLCDLAEIMQKIKGKSARVLNERLGLQGTFWAKEYYDKVLRDEKQIRTTVEYVMNNPIKVGLEDCEKRTYLRNTGFSL